MIFDYLERRVGDRWAGLRCLDLGCHEGYFALQLALRGCSLSLRSTSSTGIRVPRITGPSS
jgi:2-polyprenyl-3-methyl-5-hydroxy-6-metoxy-1,4-benzoquinol methylase